MTEKLQGPTAGACLREVSVLYITVSVKRELTVYLLEGRGGGNL